MKIITGFHAIEECLRTGAGTSEGGKAKLWFNKPGPRVKSILDDAKIRGIPAEAATAEKLDELVSSLSKTSRDHRGVVLTIEGAGDAVQNFVSLEAFLAEKKDSPSTERSVVLLLDSITDPHNVGAILRSSDQFGVDLVVMPQRRGALPEGEVIARTSAGASSWVPLSLVTNLVRSIEQLKEAGYWVYGADAAGTSIKETKLTGKIVLVMGSEGDGISRLVKENCDSIISIPTMGKLDSLNVSVACGILLFATI